MYKFHIVKELYWATAKLSLTHMLIFSAHGTMYISSIFLFWVRKYPIYCLTTQPVTFFSMWWMADVSRLFDIVLSYMTGNCLLIILALHTWYNVGHFSYRYSRLLYSWYIFLFVVLYDRLLYSGQITISRYSSYTYLYHS